jgi:hypothetical protein
VAQVNTALELPVVPDSNSNLPAAAISGLEAALAYLARGFSCVPQRPGDKRPCVRWKPFQERVPTPEELRNWYRQWPDAGVTVVLGPVSNLFVVDVDGAEAHEALLAKLGSEPRAPKVLSGSGRPCRYHLFFRHPTVATRAKATPWHPKLEFRGQGGIVVLPPSLHSSGTRYAWVPGQSLDELELPEVPAPVLEALTIQPARADVRRSTSPLDPGQLNAVMAAAREYVGGMPAAIEGQGGDRQLYAVACRLVLDFALSPAQALPLLLEYNQRCQPPWAEADLRHKLDQADRQPGERGTRIGHLIQDRPALPQDAEPFYGWVPDFLSADWELARPVPLVDDQGRPLRGRPQAMRGLDWLIRLAIISQASSSVVLPDVFLAQCVWGSRRSWPPNWRSQIGNYWKPKVWKQSRQMLLRAECTPACPLHGRQAPAHSHFCPNIVNLAKYLGCLEVFIAAHDPATGIYTFNFKRVTGSDEAETRQLEKNLRAFRRIGQLVSVYLPALVFGASSRCGLTQAQQQLLVALTRETTRFPHSEREDRAQVFVGGQGRAQGQASRTSPCPFLEAGVRYVGFNGNGGFRRRHHRGLGYQLIGKSSAGWMPRAGYPVSSTFTGWGKAVQRFLTDLQTLAGHLGLVAAGYHPGQAQWMALEDMIPLVKTRAGHLWLGHCLLRIYTRADYLVRWRDYFARRLGFAFIPGGRAEAGPVHQPSPAVTPIRSAVDLQRWMRGKGLTDRALANELGVSRSYVSRVRSGRKHWSEAFEERLTEWQRAGGGGCSRAGVAG